MSTKPRQDVGKRPMPIPVARRRRRKPGRPAKTSVDEIAVNERMLSVAAELFAAKGYADVSIRDIAEQSGVTLSSLYHYFGDKRGLYLQVHLQELNKSSSRLEAAVAQGETPEEHLFAFTTELCRVLSEPGPLFKLVARHWLDASADVVTYLAQATVPEQYKRVREVIQQISPDRNPTATALAIYALVHGLVTLRPFEESLPWKSGIARSAAPMAEFALTTLMPEVNWGRISKQIK
ncbi:MAG: TetR/AcrR family transcriptional regulator [Steroidobacteraceae bacterium]